MELGVLHLSPSLKIRVYLEVNDSVPTALYGAQKTRQRWDEESNSTEVDGHTLRMDQPEIEKKASIKDGEDLKRRLNK